MKPSKFITTLFLFFVTIRLFSQEFQTTFIAESAGTLDTIILGFDNSASIGIDNQFGEVDLSNSAFDTIFEIRSGQIDWSNLNCGPNSINSNPDLVTYMSAIDIVPRDCDGWGNSPTINGSLPFSSIFIRNKDLPIILRWDPSVFDNECLERSLITDWHPGGWFDAVCGNPLSIESLNLVSQDSVLITDPSGIFLIDSFGDTLSMFHVALGGYAFIGKLETLPAESIKIFPNPTNGIVNIESEEVSISLIETYDSGGRLISSSKMTQSVDLSGYPDGIFFIKIYADERFLVKKINKFPH